MSYLIRRVLAKPRLILDEMCRLYGKFASYLRRDLCKTRLIFPRINGPIIAEQELSVVLRVSKPPRQNRKCFEKINGSRHSSIHLL